MIELSHYIRLSQDERKHKPRKNINFFITSILKVVSMLLLSLYQTVHIFIAYNQLTIIGIYVVKYK